MLSIQFKSTSNFVDFYYMNKAMIWSWVVSYMCENADDLPHIYGIQLKRRGG